VLGVPRPLYGNDRGGALDVAEILRRQLDGYSTDVLLRRRSFFVPGMGTIQGF